jgi:hypothetical protein
VPLALQPARVPMVTCVKSLETASAFMRSLLVPGANRVTTTPAFWNDEVVIGIGIAAAFAPQCS